MTPPHCSNCGHAYGEHNGRSYMPFGGVGPNDRFHWGSGCSHPEDSRHTCPCAEWMIELDGKRTTQRMLEMASR